MPQLEHIEAIEKRLWSAADNLRANSNYASNEYFLPVMGLLFLRHAYSRYLAAEARIEPGLPSRSGKTRALSKEDLSQQGAIFLRPNAQFDHLLALPDSADRARAIIEAMEFIEVDYENLRGVLPKGEYQERDKQVLGYAPRRRYSGGIFFGNNRLPQRTQSKSVGRRDGTVWCARRGVLHRTGLLATQYRALSY